MSKHKRQLCVERKARYQPQRAKSFRQASKSRTKKGSLYVQKLASRQLATLRRELKEPKASVKQLYVNQLRLQLLTHPDARDKVVEDLQDKVVSTRGTKAKNAQYTCWCRL